MSVTNRMNKSKAFKSNVKDKLYREERSYRSDVLVEKWARIPEVGAGLKNFSEGEARNLAIHMENQARFMSRLNEHQTSQSFQGLSPENMLRLVRLAYPNTIRNKLFTEFAMESAKDSIKYVRPVYTETQWGNDMDDRFNDKGNLLDGSNDIQADDYRKAMYESTEDRYVHEMANALVVDEIAADTLFIAGTAVGEQTAATDTKFVVFGGAGKEANAFARHGYIDGYSMISGEAGEQDPRAVQVKGAANLAVGGSFLIAPEAKIVITKIAEGVYKVVGEDAAAVAGLKAYGRFDSEGDFNGDSLGEVELVMTDYWFRPRPTSIGVTWNQLSELVLDTSFGVSAEELLVDYAGQEIKKALDFRAVKIAYQAAKMNPTGYTVEFDAASGDATNDSYLHTAQTFSQAIERVGDVMLNDIGRGGVSRIVGGPAATTYLRLNSGFSTKGAQSRIGGHQIGELYDIPVFKVPSSIIKDDELVCVWKNDENEADVAIAFGTLVPFFSTGVIQRKNFYKESALATYGDWSVLNKKYLGLIKIKGIRQIS